MDTTTTGRERTVNAAALERALLNSGFCWSMATDATGVIEVFSEGAERALGYAAAEVVGSHTPASLADPNALIVRATVISARLGVLMAPGFEPLVVKAAPGNEDVYPLTYIHKNGGRVPATVSVTTLRDDHNALRGFLLICTSDLGCAPAPDASAPLDRRLPDWDGYLRALIDSNGDALLLTDAGGIITDVNSRTASLTGRTREALIGQPLTMFFTDRAQAEAAINRALVEGRVVDHVLTTRALDGTLTTMSYNAATFYDRQRNAGGVVVSGRDMSGAKRAVWTLIEQNAVLAAATRLKSEFLAHMSHELRAPLNSIIGLAGVLKDGLLGDMSDQQRTFVGLVLGGGEELLSVVNDILDLSKVEAGKMVLHLEPVDVSAVIDGELALIQPAAARRRLDVSSDIPEGLLMRGDGHRIRQIVHNLIANAVKFTIDEGEVTVRARRGPRAIVGPPIESATDQLAPPTTGESQEFLQISVNGTGRASGVGSQREVANVFRPFSGRERQLPREMRGTGLELALVRGLTQLHGGAVASDHCIGGGSCLTMWLPLPELDGHEPPTASASAGGRTVLMVEGDVRTAAMLRAILEAEGFPVLHATSAEAALVMAVQQPVSLITLDLILPGMDGWELLHRIQQMPTLRRVPVVIISTAASQARGYALGAAAVMRKPISRYDLCEALRELGLFPSGPSKTLRVLIADDDPKSVELVAVRIEAMASTVLRAFGGAEAIEIARRERPNLVLLDLMMPEVNGFDVVDALKHSPETATIPIIVLTAKKITAADRARLKGEVVTILEKSAFDSEYLQAEVRRAVAGRSVHPRGPAA